MLLLLLWVSDEEIERSEFQSKSGACIDALLEVLSSGMKSITGL